MTLPALFRAQAVLSSALLVGIAIISLVASATFAKDVRPWLWPWTVIQAEAAWKDMAETVRQEMATNGFVRNRPLGMMDSELKTRLQERHALLEHTLGCKDCVVFREER